MISVIVNPASGGGRAAVLASGVRSELERLRIGYTMHVIGSFDEAAACARAAQANGTAAVALGGDGLISALARALRGTDGILGILPAGRGNDFARVLGIPLDPVAACEVLATGTPVRLDVGRAGERTFLGIASCGLDSVANRIANQTRLVRGKLVYAYGGLRALAIWKPARFRLRLDGERLALGGYTVAIANSPAYGGGMRIAPDASLTDGLFDVVLLSDLSRARFLIHLPKVFSGSHTDLPFVKIVRAREVEVEADRPLTVYADGEPLAELPIKLTVQPAAIRVQVPAGSSLAG
jgi:YegS/Rv2252/BmrU family lipid kinase